MDARLHLHGLLAIFLVLESCSAVSLQESDSIAAVHDVEAYTSRLLTDPLHTLSYGREAIESRGMKPLDISAMMEDMLGSMNMTLNDIVVSSVNASALFLEPKFSDAVDRLLEALGSELDRLATLTNATLSMFEESTEDGQAGALAVFRKEMTETNLTITRLTPYVEVLVNALPQHMFQDYQDAIARVKVFVPEIPSVIQDVWISPKFEHLGRLSNVDRQKFCKEESVTFRNVTGQLSVALDAGNQMLALLPQGQEMLPLMVGLINETYPEVASKVSQALDTTFNDILFVLNNFLAIGERLHVVLVKRTGCDFDSSASAFAIHALSIVVAAAGFFRAV